MKRRMLLGVALLLALALAVMGSSFTETGEGGSEDGPVLAGSPADTLAASGVYYSSWFYCWGAEKIIVWVRDSVPSAVYSDTLAAASMQFTNDSLTVAGAASRWSTMPLAAVALAVNDTIGVSSSGKLSNMSLNPATAGNHGYIAAHIWGSSPNAALPPERFIPAAWCRLRLVNQARKRSAAVTGNAAMMGLRVRIVIVGKVSGLPSGSDWREGMAP